MILVDSAVWIDHFRQSAEWLEHLLRHDQVLGHPVVIAELALGSIPRREETLRNLGYLPRAAVADDAEVLHLIERAELAGSGIGYADAHLLASTLLGAHAQLWTTDRRLHQIAERLGVSATPA
jgi:predicted nucleic acid-binding protein